LTADWPPRIVNIIFVKDQQKYLTDGTADLSTVHICPSIFRLNQNWYQNFHYQALSKFHFPTKIVEAWASIKFNILCVLEHSIVEQNPKLKSNIPPRLRSMNVFAKVNMQYRNKVYWHLWGQKKNKYENNNLEYFLKELHR
jgi:hypothetical protein